MIGVTSVTPLVEGCVISSGSQGIHWATTVEMSVDGRDGSGDIFDRDFSPLVC